MRQENKIQIGDVTPVQLTSRYLLAPINTGFARNGHPSDRLLDFHRRRSGESIGISFVGNVGVNKDFRTNSSTLYFRDALAPWTELSETILRSGSIPGLQIACKLPSAAPALKWRNRSVGTYISTARKRISEMQSSEIRKICQDFIDAACFASRAGFRVVQIHAAHGYFLSQLLTPSINRRSDRFGHDGVEAIKVIVEGIRTVAPKLIVDIRVSILDGIDSEKNELMSRTSQIETIVGLGPEMISISAGHYEVDRFMIYPRKSSGYALYYPHTVRLAQLYPDIYWNVAGNFWRLPHERERVPDNLLISIGRSLIADPDFVSKQIKGNSRDVNACVRSGHCHYFTRGKPHIECNANKNV